MTINEAKDKIENLQNSIFFRLNFEGDFKLLTDYKGDPITDMSEAKKLVRGSVGVNNYVELAAYPYAILNCGVWDNV